MRITCISDLHSKIPILKKGDMLIIAGDIGIMNESNLLFFIDWLCHLNYKYIVWTAGNHDRYMEELYKKGVKLKMPKNIHYLLNSSVEIEGIKIWGSPFTTYYNGWSFMEFLPELKKRWAKIPDDTDIIVTHGQPFGINDVVGCISQGCPALRDRIKIIRPKIYIGGHLHENGAKIYQDEHTTYINCSLMNEFYDLVNEPVVINYEN